jgi:hypothetical protein
MKKYLLILCATALPFTAYCNDDKDEILEKRLAETLQDYCDEEQPSSIDQALKDLGDKESLMDRSGGFHRKLNNYQLQNILHQVIKSSVDGEALETADGSIYEVCSAGQRTAARWAPGSLVYFTPNKGIFGIIKSDHDLWMVNYHTEEVVEVDMIAQPYSHSDYAQWVTHVDATAGIIELRNGQVAKAHPSDQDMLYDWHYDDHLVLGCNDDWGHRKFPYILFNTRTKQVIRVKALF